MRKGSSQDCHPSTFQDSGMATSTMRGLLDLPTELTHLIAQNLDTLDRMRMRISCPALYAIIPPPTLSELFKLEYTDLGCLLNFYTCATCKRLRPRWEFADSMVKKRRSKLSLSQDVRKRFCVDCGIEPDPIYGSKRYTPGSQIAIFGKQFAVCRSCWEFAEAAVEDGRNTSECISCRTTPGAREQHARRIEEERRARASGDTTGHEVAPRSPRGVGLCAPMDYEDTK